MCIRDSPYPPSSGVPAGLSVGCRFLIVISLWDSQFPLAACGECIAWLPVINPGWHGEQISVAAITIPPGRTSAFTRDSWAASHCPLATPLNTLGEEIHLPRWYSIYQLSWAVMGPWRRGRLYSNICWVGELSLIHIYVFTLERATYVNPTWN